MKVVWIRGLCVRGLINCIVYPKKERSTFLCYLLLVINIHIIINDCLYLNCEVIPNHL